MTAVAYDPFEAAGRSTTGKPTVSDVSTLDLSALADVLRRTDQLEAVDVALGIAAAGVPVLPVAPRTKKPMLTSDHTSECARCRKVELKPEKDHGATTDPDTIQRWYAAHADAGVGMKDHPALLRGDGDFATADDSKSYRKAAGFTTAAEPAPCEASTPGGPYRRRFVHSVPEGQVIAGGGTEALGVSWYQNSGYVVVKGIHPDAGIPYPRFHGDITPVPAAVVEALTRGGSRTVGDSESSVSMGTASAFLDAHKLMTNPRYLERRRRNVATARAGDRHHTAITELTAALKDAMAGHYPARTAVVTIKAALLEAGWDADRFKPNAQGHSEWTDLVRWAVAQVQDLDPAQVRAEIDERRSAAQTAALSDQEPPPSDEDYVDLTDEALERALKDWGAGTSIATAERAADLGRFRFHRLGDRLSDIPPVEFDIDGYRIRPTFGTTAGELKTLKSTVAMAVYVAQAAGVAALGHFAVPRPRPVLYVVGEGGEVPFLRRMVRLRDAYGLTDADLAHFAYTADTAPMNDLSFVASILGQLEALEADAGCAGTVIIDPKYAVHPADTDARNLMSEGAMLRAATAPIADAGWSFDLVDHFNQTGTGLGLKRVTMAGAGEWADSWTLLAHREPPKVDDGSFRLDMQVGSRQWGGADWWLDVELGRFDADLMEHDGDIRFTVRRPEDRTDDHGADEDAATALAITKVFQRARKPVTRTDVVTRVKGRAVDTRRVLSEMVDDGRVVEHQDQVEDARGRRQTRVVLTLCDALSNVTTLRPRGTS